MNRMDILFLDNEGMDKRFLKYLGKETPRQVEGHRQYILFLARMLSKKHKIFFDTWMKEHVEQVITERLTAFLKGHPKIDALCSVQPLTIGDCKE